MSTYLTLCAAVSPEERKSAVADLFAAMKSLAMARAAARGALALISSL